MADPGSTAPTRHTRRRCVLCKAILADSNTSDECFHHVPPRKGTLSWLLEIMREVTVELKATEIEYVPLPEVNASTREVSQEFFEEVVRTVAKTYGVTYESIIARTRISDVVHARHVAMYVLSDMGCTLVSIGAFFDRDHTTVLHARDQIRKFHSEDERVEQVQKIFRRNIHGDM